jgi:YHS domain-containing protein
MIKLIILLAIGYLLYQVVKPAPKKRPLSRESTAAAAKELQVHDEMVQDPVCRTFVPMREAVLLHRGEMDYYFCSTECRDVFIDREKNLESTQS